MRYLVPFSGVEMVMDFFAIVFDTPGNFFMGTDFEMTEPVVSSSSFTISAKISQAPVAPDTPRILAPSLFPVQTQIR